MSEATPPILTIFNNHLIPVLRLLSVRICNAGVLSISIYNAII